MGSRFYLFSRLYIIHEMRSRAGAIPRLKWGKISTTHRIFLTNPIELSKGRSYEVVMYHCLPSTVTKV